MSGNKRPRVLVADAAGVAEAVRVLRRGGLVAVPTETVYGLAARADQPEAVAAIYRAKGRPDFNPLIVHVVNLEEGEQLARFDSRSRDLARAFWPGALTLVLPLRADAGLAPAVTAGLATVALRCPAHPAMRAVLAETGLPLAAPSANRSGAVSPTRAEHVVASLGSAVELVMDGGACEQGIESTIVAVRETGWEVLRPGPVSAEQIAKVVGSAGAVTSAGGIEAPGQLVSHYAPGKPLRLDASQSAPDEFLIGFGSIAGDISLSSQGDLAEAAARLYECLHRAAAATQPRIAVAPVPKKGVGAAINDRLGRAAA